MGNNITTETAKFLLNLVNGLTLNVGASDFDAVLADVVKARKELQTIIGEPAEAPESSEVKTPPHPTQK